MFERPENTYTLSKGSASRIISDIANPLTQAIEEIDDGSVVLDVGAGNGILPMLLAAKKKQVTIDGVEPSVAAAKIAKPYYRNFYQGYLQDFYSQIKENNYDYIVLADVIEHVINPEEFLRDLISHIRPKTKILLSTPNVAFATIRLALLEGNFNYVNSGILEKTHLRFFTKDSLEEMIKNLGIGIHKVKYLQRRVDRTEVPLRKKKHAFLLPWLLKDSTASTYQFFLVLSKRGQSHDFKDAELVGEATRLRSMFFNGK